MGIWERYLRGFGNGILQNSDSNGLKSAWSHSKWTRKDSREKDSTSTIERAPIGIEPLMQYIVPRAKVC